MVGFVKGCVIVSLVVIVLIAFLPENSSFFKGSSTIRYILPVVEIMKNTTPGDVKARYTEKVKKLKSVWGKQK